MTLKNTFAAVAALSLVAAPTVAAAAPAKKLSVAGSVRANAAAGNASAQDDAGAGTFIVPVLAVLAAGAGLYFALDKDNDRPSSRG